MTSSRARSTLLPFDFSHDELADLDCFKNLQADQVGENLEKAREEVGDALRPGFGDGLGPSDRLYVGFCSLFQGDRLGVDPIDRIRLNFNF